jgi:hypothetical protein
MKKKVKLEKIVKIYPFLVALSKNTPKAGLALNCKNSLRSTIARKSLLS